MFCLVGLFSRGLTTSQSAAVRALRHQSESEEEAVGFSSLGKTDPGNLGREGTAEDASSLLGTLQTEVFLWLGILQY